MKLFRLNRLFNGKSRRCFDVAIDHGFFNELGFLSGIEDLEKAVETLVGAGPDAIQLTAGQAEVLQRIPGKAKPALVLRTDLADVYGRALPRTLFSRMIDQAVEYMVDGDLNKIMPLVRQAVELGADVIKADPTDNPLDYHRVVEVARVPVLARGGGKAEDLAILRRTEQLIGQGAAGIVYGRNVIQHANPAGMTKALMAIVHDGSTAEEARRFLSAKGGES